MGILKVFDWIEEVRVSRARALRLPLLLLTLLSLASQLVAYWVGVSEIREGAAALFEIFVLFASSTIAFLFFGVSALFLWLSGSVDFRSEILRELLEDQEKRARFLLVRKIHARFDEAAERDFLLALLADDRAG
jgi:hypothetical protein